MPLAPDPLRDSIWQFIQVLTGIAIFIIGTALTVYIFRRSRMFKELTYSIISTTPLLRIGEEIRGKVTVLLDERPVQSISLILVRIRNSGRQPIISTDYERPISLGFGEIAQILSVDISQKSPKNLRIPFHIEGERIEFEKVLINPRDSFIVKVLIGEFSPPVTADWRIAGVEEVKEVDPETQNTLRSTLFQAIGAVMGTLGILFAVVQIYIPGLLATLLAAIIAPLVTFVFLYAYANYLRKNRRRLV